MPLRKLGEHLTSLIRNWLCGVVVHALSRARADRLLRAWRIQLDGNWNYNLG